MLMDDGLELLDENECARLLQAGGIGRVGVTINGLPVILPVNYSWLDGDVIFRTGPGSKLRAASRHAVIAFEIDAHDTELRTGWSVLAIGRSELVDEPEERSQLERFLPQSFAGGTRDAYVRLHPEMLTGRRIAPEHLDGGGP